MAPTGNIIMKKKKKQMISRSQLAGYLITGARISLVNSKKDHSSTLQETSIRRSLFFENTTPNLPNSGKDITRKELSIEDDLTEGIGVHQSMEIGIPEHIGGDEEVNCETPPTMGEDGANRDTEITPIGSNETHSGGSQVDVQKKLKGRGVNKRKVLDKPVFVDVNEDLVPISDSQRQISSLIGYLARDPRKLPLDCFDWRNMEEANKDMIWMEVKKRSKIGAVNRSKNEVAHYSGTKSHARVRAEEEAKGNKIDRLKAWLLTHKPKKGSKLDDVSAMRKELIDKELACMEDMQVGTPARDEIFEKVVGEDKYGYAKTFGMGVKLPRSNSKRCVLKEEKAKRLKVEQEHKETQVELKETKVELKETKSRLQILEDAVVLLLKNQGLSGNLSNITDLTSSENGMAEENHDEDGCGEDDEARSDEIEVEVEVESNEDER